MEKSKTRSLLMKKAVSRAAALMDRTVGAEGAALIRSILIGICVAVVTFLLGMSCASPSHGPLRLLQVKPGL